MNTNTTNTKTFKAVLASLIAENKLIADKPIKVDGRQIIKSAANGEIYVLNTEKNKAFRYSADASECVVIPCGEFNRQVSLYKARLQQAMLDRHTAEVRAKEAERRAAYNEVGNINAPATATAIRLDAEREDSKFDGRQADEVFNKSAVEAYEETGDSLLDEGAKDLRGYHRAVLTAWESVTGKVKTLEDGTQRVYKPYVKLTLLVDGEEIKSRAYERQFNSFKIQANQRYNNIFFRRYMKDSEKMNELKGKTFDIWLKWNEFFYNEETQTRGEYQAEFYDEAASRARKAEQAKVAVESIRGSYGRPTENKATR